MEITSPAPTTRAPDPSDRARWLVFPSIHTRHRTLSMTSFTITSSMSKGTPRQAPHFRDLAIAVKLAACPRHLWSQRTASMTCFDARCRRRATKTFASFSPSGSNAESSSLSETTYRPSTGSTTPLATIFSDFVSIIRTSLSSNKNLNPLLATGRIGSKTPTASVNSAAFPNTGPIHA